MLPAHSGMGRQTLRDSVHRYNAEGVYFELLTPFTVSESQHRVMPS